MLSSSLFAFDKIRTTAYSQFAYHETNTQKGGNTSTNLNRYETDTETLAGKIKDIRIDITRSLIIKKVSYCLSLPIFFLSTVAFNVTL